MTNLMKQKDSLPASLCYGMNLSPCLAQLSNAWAMVGQIRRTGGYDALYCRTMEHQSPTLDRHVAQLSARRAIGIVISTRWSDGRGHRLAQWRGAALLD